ncbi:MAG: DUF554 domain-containing protein [Eubacteriales bacterium]|nr:DUF554 domain-containing protein [Eubacteriales bacterium]
MIGLGTIVNVTAIVGGGVAGMLFGKLLSERYQETIFRAVAFANIIMALGGTMAQMLVVNVSTENAGPAASSAIGSAVVSGSLITASLDTQGIMMMIISLALGALVGEFINLDSRFETFGAWLKEKSGNQGDTAFIDAFVTASITVCVGAMAIIGSIQDGINGDPNTLFAKSVLDLIIIMILTASLGKGCIFSAIPVGIWQGAVTLLAGFIAPIMTPAALSNISYVGNVLIMCVGINLIWPKTIRVANVLPALVFAVGFAFL